MIWPFATRIDGPRPGVSGSGQWRRIDQGQDLQADVGTPVLAVADGTISYGHNASGFGDPYPILTFDQPIDGNPCAYYGHQHPEVPAGARVHQGDVICHASPVPGGNAHNLPGWIELGWWRNGPTGNGQSMHDHLLNAPVFGSQPGPTPQEDDLRLTLTTDPGSASSGGYWRIRLEDGATYAYNGAAAIPGLNTHPEWKADADQSGGNAHVQGAVPILDPHGQWGLRFEVYFDSDGTVHQYNIGRDGQPF